MSRTGPSGGQSSVQRVTPRGASSCRSRVLQQSELWIELTRQRAQLLVILNASLMGNGEAEVCSDLADQASTEFEQDLAMQVRSTSCVASSAHCN